MPSEIPATRAPQSLPTLNRSSGSELPANSLRLLESLPQQIAAGQQLQAQVVASREAADLFNVLLRLQLPNGEHTQIQAQSGQHLTPGQTLALTALSGQHFSLATAALQQADMLAARAGASLQLLEAVPGQVSSGQQLSAQVLGVRDLGNQQFSLQLRLQLPNGQQVNMQAQSNQPASVGQNLVMTALGGQTFSLSAAGPAAVMQLTRFDPAQYPAGSQIQARVLQVEARPQGNFQITLTLNNGAHTGDHFTVESPKALAVNSLISARVNGSFELSLIPAGQNFRQLAVQQELGGQFVRQGSPAAVLQQLMQLTGEGAAALDKLPSDSQKLIQQLLGSLPELGGKLSGPQLAELIKNSGILLESRLHADAASQQDIKANLLRLIAQILPQQAHANPLGAATQAGLTSQALPQLLRELGGPAASLREQALRFPVTSRILEKLDNPNDLGSLLRLAAAAISRLQTHQLSSLAQTYTTQDGTQVTTWQTEVPMRDQANVVPLQVRFQQEQHNPADEHNQQPPVWRLELSFDIDPLGPMHVQVNLQEDNLSSLLWAERERTASLVSKELHVLRDKLLAAGLNIRELDCRQGIPPAAPKALIEQRWIDDLA